MSTPLELISTAVAGSSAESAPDVTSAIVPALIPHPNELNTLSHFQKKLCAALCLAPVLPLYVRFSVGSAHVTGNVAAVKDVLSDGTIRACTILAPVYAPDNGTVSCSAQVTLSATQGEMMLTGKLTLARLFSTDSDSREKAVSIQNALETLASEEGSSIFPLRLPVFKAAQVAVTESHNAVHWEVRTERWIKAQRVSDALSAQGAQSAGKN